MGFLDEILAGRRLAVERTRARLDEIEEIARQGPPARDFRLALAEDGISLIGEIKRRSPSKGDLNVNLDPIEIAQAYERGGARALSVLTEPDFFLGSSEDVSQAHDATGLPVLWKDFVIDRAQVVEACATRADAVLLIVRILDDATLRELMDEARRWSLAALVEIFDEADLERAMDVGADVVGVNHRDLESFEEDPTATRRLRPLIPDDVVVVAESAINTRQDVQALEDMGVHAVLVGETLVTAADPENAVRELLGR